MDWTFSDIPDGQDIRNASREEWNYHRLWDDGYVLTGYNLHIVQGIDKQGTFAPAALLTRAQVAQMLYNIGYYKIDSVPGAYKKLHYLNGGTIAGDTISVNGQ